MEQFSLEKYLANPSRKVVTRDGRRARIICTDMNYQNYPIVALVQISDKHPKEGINTYTENGKLDFEHPYRDDLFFAPEKHEGWVNIYKSKYGGYELSQVYQRKEDAESEKYINDSDAYITTTKIEWEE